MSLAEEENPVLLRSATRRISMTGALGLLALLALFGIWANTTVISGAVIAQGQTVVRGQPKVVQHLDGGIVAEIAVQNGDLVAAGELLMRLDPALLRLNLDVAYRRLADALTLKARLEAEQKNTAAPVFEYPNLPFDLPDMTGNEISQREIFDARAAIRRGLNDKLIEAEQKYDSQIAGQIAQVSALDEQITLLEADLQNMQTLAARDLILRRDLNEMQRSRAEMVGRRAGLEAEIARLSNTRRDSELQTLQNQRAFHEDVVTQLREVTTSIEELVLDIVTRTAQLDRVEVRAPVAGVVHELQVSTVGGVVAPGAVIVQVIPQDQGLDFEVRVNPRDIAQVYVGQPATAIIAAFDPRTTPKLEGKVTQISPTAIIDPQSGQQYFRATFSIPPTEIAELGSVDIVPGMPVEGYLATTDRSVLGYMLSPLHDPMRRMFRER
ncbi:HlyD family type I secretion periplasmic adaptor subunit [Roseobacter litoralis]|uniref:HlyD family type I secretion periplasmic adaptor subunit n=1 Tax=Roseobacter litoralis TaxID=42443 RepID=UPI0024928BBE|nr:HlyD family type I secretion periplasmic adaptor subunit [Roseobacter litoralis]